MKKLRILPLLLIFVFGLCLQASAHSGGTDANGGHRDNQNKSGLGGYHYHCGGYPAHLHSGGVCPYAAPTPTPTPTPTPKPANTKTAQLVYKDIKITLDGQTVTPKDANGNVVEPFIIDGVTYLPVRAVGNALGLDVDWDSATNTVQLSTPKN